MLILNVIALTLSLVVSDAKQATIPLDKIWGYQLPGTRPLLHGRHMTTGKPISDESPIVKDIVRIIDTIDHKSVAKPAFVVQGEQLDALLAARKVIQDKYKADDTFKPNEELTAVFFSHSLARYVRLVEVAKDGKVIRVKYRFEPHIDAGLTCHFALIPLGKLSPGKYEIKIDQLPMEKVWKDLKTPKITEQQIRRVICQSTEFFVKGQAEP